MIEHCRIAGFPRTTAQEPCSALVESAASTRRDGRVVECTGFEIRRTGLPVPRVRIPLSPPPFPEQRAPSGTAKASHLRGFLLGGAGRVTSASRCRFISPGSERMGIQTDPPEFHRDCTAVDQTLTSRPHNTRRIVWLFHRPTPTTATGCPCISIAFSPTDGSPGTSAP
jgi:hypothetical protein